MSIPRILALLAVVGVLAACDVVAPNVNPPDDIQAARMPDGSTGRFLVEYTGNVDRVVAAVHAAGGEVGRIHASIEVLEVTGLTAPALAKLPGVQHVTPDIIVDMLASYPIHLPPYDFFGLPVGAYQLDPASTPNANPAAAYLFPCQWNLQQVQAPQAWATGARGAGVRIALLDSGVQHDHIELAGKVDVARSANLLTHAPAGCPAADRDPGLVIDYANHGTLVSSLITSNNIGVAGVAPGATVVMVKVTACNNTVSAADVLAGIVHAADLDVDIISMSLYFDVERGRFTAMYQKAANYATRQGKLLIGTAANDAIDLGTLKNRVRIPTMLANVYSAYATDHLDQLAAYSSYGHPANWVGAPAGSIAPVTAALPGCPAAMVVQNRVPLACSGQTIRFPFNIWCRDGSTSTYLIGSYGTSFATPTVAGVAALVGGTRAGGFNPHQLATILAQTADDLGAPGVDNYYSHGRANAARAVQRR
jgi:lantibiotic leader peptide-processing serine protease